MNFDYPLQEQVKMIAAIAALRAAQITSTVDFFSAVVDGSGCFQVGTVHRIVVRDNDASRAAAILSAPDLRSTLC